MFLAAGCLAANLPSSYVPPAVPAAPVRAQPDYVPPLPEAAAPVRVEQSYVPPASQPAAAAPVRNVQSYVPPTSVAVAPTTAEQNYVTPAPQPVPAAAPVKQLTETYVPSQSSSKIEFPPDSQPAPWHPDPRPKPKEEFVVSGGAAQPQTEYVPPAQETPSAQPPRQTYVPPTEPPTKPPRQTYVPPAEPPRQTYVPPAQPAQPPKQAYVPPYWEDDSFTEMPAKMKPSRSAGAQRRRTWRQQPAMTS